MADARFYDNRGPFPLSGICAAVGISVPSGADATAEVTDIAALADARATQLSFFVGARGRKDLATTEAGWCLMPQGATETTPSATTPLFVPSAQHGFAAVARLFYPDHELGISAQETHVHPSARLGEGVVLAPGVVIGPGAEIGRGTRIGAYSVIGRSVAVGRGSEIGAHVSISFAYLGDEIVVQSGARIGGSGFGFASSRTGHEKMPQLGRVIIQDRVEIGANACIDRGMVGDTVIGEGTKIDNLVHVAHNVRVGRHCIITADVGIAGSATLGDFVMIGGKAGLADHVSVGDGVRIAGMAGVMSDLPPGSGEYVGLPARPARTYFKEQAVLARLTKSYKKTKDE